MAWKVQSFIPGSWPREYHSIEEHDDEAAALSDYQDRATSIRDSGGAAELRNPAGEMMAFTVRPIAKNDDATLNVTINPELDARLARVEELAENDARDSRDPQVLTGDLSDLQGYYDDIYQETLVEIAPARGSN